MAEKIKTTVYLDRNDYRHLKEIAATEASTPAEQIREAIAEYVSKRRKRKLPSAVGSGRSGSSDLSERAEDLLGSFGKD